ncbi:hypothetical protein KNP414_05186 [Paenibacillus mucilaginosus KNP414]|uniref:Uncharacterized protein n=1 Tax=Paenibacillus mucilaginosus (strain KNP414) TaxID=1036673 RepID=F8FBU9_PAEMK|nr:hypothetical protein KNP414_05186 [Paenibacillus mucilaginosus KNP414]
MGIILSVRMACPKIIQQLERGVVNEFCCFRFKKIMVVCK